MMSLGNDFVSGPITAKGVSVAIRSYPKKLQKSRGARRCPSSSPKGSDGLGWAFHHGEGCCQGVAMCPSPSKWITINLASCVSGGHLVIIDSEEEQVRDKHT